MHKTTAWLMMFLVSAAVAFPKPARADCSTSNPAGADTQSLENAHGSFDLDVGGDVDVQLVFSKAAFRNFFLIVQPATAPSTCQAAGTTLNQCFLDTNVCASCPGCNLPSDCSCECIFNETHSVGTFAAGTNFQAQLQVDEGRDGTIDHVWYWDPSMNGDDDHNGVPD